MSSKVVSTVVRRAVLSDVSSVAELFNGYRMFYEQPDDYAKCEQFLRERLENEQSVVFLAEEEGEAKGFCQMYPLFSSVRCRHTWLLNDLFVSADRRRTGVGGSLMQAAEDHARNDGAAQILLETAESNVPGQQLYESRGWELETDVRHYALTFEA